MMEDLSGEDSVEAKSRVLNISSAVREGDPAKRTKSSRRKWVILVIIFMLVVVPATSILIKSLNNARMAKQYEDCIRECVLSKNSGESESKNEIPYRNCFQYCRE